MRIVAGSLKGRALVAPEGQGTRPTSDRARQAIFNVLEHAAWAEPLAGARVMDLFAGSGALGFEAMSRGELSLSRIIADLPFKRVPVPEGERTSFMNINTPEEYEFARAKREQEQTSA